MKRDLEGLIGPEWLLLVPFVLCRPIWAPLLAQRSTTTESDSWEEGVGILESSGRGRKESLHQNGANSIKEK